MKAMDVLPFYKDSFSCGLERKDGLQLKMMYNKGVVSCDVNIDNRFEGYTDVLHGGMIFGILDVIIWCAIFMETKKICMTRHTEMDFLKPVMCNTPYIAKGKFLNIEERDFLATAWMEDRNGELCASVNAIFREAKDILVERFISKFDFSRTSPEIRRHFYSLLDERT
jgi:acyl-coenzyme A thioesterase PaaI-like protein